MTEVRWTKHKTVDAAGNHAESDTPIDIWRIAQAAAEETLQGSPMAPAWLTLFRSHLSSNELRLLRWSSDLAESAELRRTYSGLYGRFVARALLTHHLKLSRFVSLNRSGIDLDNSLRVRRQSHGDIPDWLAWDEVNHRFVLCEAKGSLTANDFLGVGTPKCILEGKRQFERVRSELGGRPYKPGQWVAATRWSTDERKVQPVTLLWDPPVTEHAFEPEEAAQHKEAISRAWLNSIARGLGAEGADNLLALARQDRTVVLRAKPGSIPDERNWPRGKTARVDFQVAQTTPSIGDTQPPRATLDLFPQEYDGSEAYRAGRRFAEKESIPLAQDAQRVDAPTKMSLVELPIYADGEVLRLREQEKDPFEGAFVAALVTSLGVRPIRTKSDFIEMQRAQERAQKAIEPAMLIGIPRDFDLRGARYERGWRDGAGLAMSNDLAVFDLREAEIKMGDDLPE